MSIPPFVDCPPGGQRLTRYDQRHLATYLRLLDADNEGASWTDAVAVIFGLDPARDARRARLVHDAHLARARWIAASGYAQLLEPRPN